MSETAARVEEPWRRSLPSILIYTTILLLTGVFTMTTMIVRRERSSCRIIVAGTGDKIHCSNCAEMTRLQKKAPGGTEDQA